MNGRHVSSPPSASREAMRLASQSGRASEYAQSRGGSHSHRSPYGSAQRDRSGHSPAHAGASGSRGDPIINKHHREMERIEELWRSTRSDLEEKERALNKWQDDVASQYKQRSSAKTDEIRRLQELAVDLKDCLRFQESQLESVSRERDQLRSALGECEAQVAELEAAVARNASLVRANGSDMEGLEGQLREERQMRKDLEERVEREDDASAQVIAQQDKHLAEFERRAEEAEAASREAAAQVAPLRATLERMRADKDASDTREERLDDLTHDLHEELLASKEELARATVGLSRLSGAADEAARLNSDVERMLGLLRAAGGEARQFAEEYEDSKGLAYAVRGGGGISSLITPEVRNAEAREVLLRVEGNHWVPAAAYELAAEFRRQHAPEVPMEAVGDLLLQLGAVWRDREKRRAIRLKTSYSRRAREWRRRAEEVPPTVEMVRMNEVAFLRKELKRASQGGGSHRFTDAETQKLLTAALGTVECLTRQVEAHVAGAASPEWAGFDTSASPPPGPTAASPPPSQQAGAEGRVRLEAALGLLEEFETRADVLSRDFQERVLQLDRHATDFYLLVMRSQARLVDALHALARAFAVDLRDAWVATGSAPDPFPPALAGAGASGGGGGGGAEALLGQARAGAGSGPLAMREEAVFSDLSSDTSEDER